LKAVFAVVATGTAVSTMDRIHVILFCGKAKGFLVRPAVNERSDI